MISFLALATVLVTLQACGPQYRTDTTYVAPKSQQGRMCANNCVLSKQQCQQACNQQSSQCDTVARLEAQNDYLAYVNDRQRLGKEVKRSQSSFYRHNRCPQVAYCYTQCEDNHHLCHNNCGGQVLQETYCVANCE